MTKSARRDLLSGELSQRKSGLYTGQAPENPLSFEGMPEAEENQHSWSNSTIMVLPRRRHNFGDFESVSPTRCVVRVHADGEQVPEDAAREVQHDEAAEPELLLHPEPDTSSRRTQA